MNRVLGAALRLAWPAKGFFNHWRQGFLYGLLAILPTSLSTLFSGPKLMNTDLATSLIATKQSGIRQSAQMRVLKKTMEMERQAIEMLTRVEKPAVPPSQGTRVDKSA